MKDLFLLFVFLSLLTTCNRPQKLLEKGKDQKAFNASLLRLQYGKVKSKHLNIFEESFNNLTERDAEIISNLKEVQHQKIWLKIYDLSLAIEKRQRKSEKINKRLQRKGFYPDLNWYPSEELIEESEYNVALYYYEEAQKLIPQAEEGNKIAARDAYDLFQDCQKYQANFKDAYELEQEMYRLGTTNIVLEPLETDLESRVSDQLFNSFFQKQKFPKRDKWKVFHLTEPKDIKMDYELAFYFDDLYDEGESIVNDVCINTETIEVGKKTVKEWSEKDSAYVNVIVPIYQDVTVVVNSYHQSKTVSMKLFCEIIELKSGDHINDFSIYNSNCWTNDYSIVSGDTRALNSSCPNFGGCLRYPPSTEDMMSEIAMCFKRGFYKKAKKKIY